MGIKDNFSGAFPKKGSFYTKYYGPCGEYCYFAAFFSWRALLFCSLLLVNVIWQTVKIDNDPVFGNAPNFSAIEKCLCEGGIDKWA
jgi:hypothetical protein